MEIEVSELPVDGWTVVAPLGEVDVATAPALRERLIAVLDGSAQYLAIDMDGVEFIDSTGLGVLVGALRRARSAGGDLRVVCTSPRILKVLEITGLDAVFRVAASTEELMAEEPA